MNEPGVKKMMTDITDKLRKVSYKTKWELEEE